MFNYGGGRVVFGITDKRPRKVVGSLAFEQPERTRKGLIDKLHVRVDFELLQQEGNRVLVFVIAGRPIGLPIQADGIAWWRDGDSLVKMPQEIQHQIFAESGHDFSGDICPPATIDELDDTAIANFRKLWVSRSGNKRLQRLSKRQLLTDVRAISDEGITYAALILFGTQKALEKHLSQSETVFECRLNHRTSCTSAGTVQRRGLQVL